MEKRVIRKGVKGFVGGLIGAFVAGLALFWFGFFDSQPLWMNAVTLVAAAVGAGIGSGISEHENTIQH